MAWTVEELPGDGRQLLLHTAATGHGRAWAFGINAGAHPFGTLVFRRDEDGWRQVDVPSIGRANRAVVCSPTEVWVVGDGTSLHGVGEDWREVPTADEKAQLFGLAAFGSTLWAAGFVPLDGVAAASVQRWDGTRWTAQPLPDIAPSWSLAGLGGVAEDDLWAVGSVHAENGPPVALHWDGAGWQSTPVSLPGDGSGELDEVLALAPDDVWASGYWQRAGTRGRLPLLVHWDGEAWSVTAAPEGTSQLRELAMVDGRPHGVGYDDGVPRVLAWDGGEWRRIDGPPVPAGAVRGFLHGGATLPDGRLLVVGAVHLSQSEARPFVAVADR